MRTTSLSAAHVIGAVPALFLSVGAFGKLLGVAPVVDGAVRLGYPASVGGALGILELACTALYVFPRTCVLGAILLTGFLGGATATHVRVGDPFVFPIFVGLLIWARPFLLDARVRALVPLRGESQG